MYKLSDPFNYENDKNYANNKPDDFWDEVAKKYVHWDKMYDRVYSGDEMNPNWFNGGKLNTCFNVLDIHAFNPLKKDQVALIYECKYLNKTIELTYYQLYEKVCEFSRVLLNLNISRDDNVLIYMASTLEPLIAMLSCARIGATHCVIYDNYSQTTLIDRIQTIEPKIILTSNFSIFNDKIVDLTSNLINAIELSNFKPNFVITHFRNNISNELDLKFIKTIKSIPNTLNWEEEIKKIKENKQKPFYEYIPIDSNHPLYIIYTSGTTGKPKSIVRGNGSHLVCLKYHYSSMLVKNFVHTFLAHHKVGGLTFHSFLYGFLSFGQSFVVSESGVSNFWKTIEKHKISISFVWPKIIRYLIKTDPNADVLHSMFNLSSLKALCAGGEVIEQSIPEYVENKIKVKCSRGYGQSESGITMILGFSHIDIPYHSCGVPSIFLKPTILSPDGKELNENEIGEISFKLPMPPSFATTFYKNDDQFKELFKKYKGHYNSGDLGYKDKNGFFSIISRLDDQIIINGNQYTLNTIENSILKHPLVLECCSIGIKTSIGSNEIIGLLVIKNEISTIKLQMELNMIISKDISPSITLRKIVILPQLPISMGGKITRSIISNYLNDSNYQLPENVGDLNLFNEIKNKYEMIR
ncbi:hypothetical protein ACTA71_006983 [Dictyostelium dimigraforme]